jgi:general secretion pathway protein G
MKKMIKSQTGFTLVEMLIVVILLGILAMVIIPQISTSTDEAKLNTLQANLAGLRNAVELYYAQHNARYPGAVRETDGTTATTDVNAPAAFLAQLTQYTDFNGQTAAVKDATFKFGPYIKSKELPQNPFTLSSTIKIDTAENDITDRTATNDTAWKFHPITGVLFANDGGAGHADL